MILRRVLSTLILLLLAGTSTAGTYLVPHFVEQAGRVGTTAATYDTTLHFVYHPGLAGTPAGAGASVDIYFFDSAGTMFGASQALCSPCQITLGGAQRKVDIAVEDRFIASGGFGALPIRQGFAVIVIGGADPDGVRAQVMQHRSNSAANDLDLTPLELQDLGFFGRLFRSGFEALQLLA